jgi:hypothetical protein
MFFSLSSVQSMYECRAEVIITHAPSTSDACETHAQPVEKSIVTLSPSALPTLSFCLIRVSTSILGLIFRNMAFTSKRIRDPQDVRVAYIPVRLQSVLID